MREQTERLKASANKEVNVDSKSFSRINGIINMMDLHNIV